MNSDSYRAIEEPVQDAHWPRLSNCTTGRENPPQGYGTAQTKVENDPKLNELNGEAHHVPLTQHSVRNKKENSENTRVGDSPEQLVFCSDFFRASRIG